MTPHVIKGVSPWQGTKSVWFKNNQRGRHIVFNIFEATVYQSEKTATQGWTSLTQKIRNGNKELGDYEWKIVPLQENENANIHL